jgi:hypothetical protein
MPAAPAGGPSPGGSSDAGSPGGSKGDATGQAGSIGVWQQCGGLGGGCATSTCVDAPFPGGRRTRAELACIMLGLGLGGLSLCEVPLPGRCCTQVVRPGFSALCCTVFTAAAGKGCSPGNACQRISEWHWQCAPSGAGVVLGAWGQCGGLGGSCATSFCVDGPFPRWVWRGCN